MKRSPTFEDLVDSWELYEASSQKAKETLLFADGLAAREAFRALNEESALLGGRPQDTTVTMPSIPQIGGNVVSFADASTMRLEQRWEIFVAAFRKSNGSPSPINDHLAGKAFYAFLVHSGHDTVPARSNFGGNIVSFPDRRSMT